MTDCIAGCQYMPSIEYFAHWLHHRRLTLEAHEHFQKRTWRNKTAIQTPGSPLILSVPLKKGKNERKPIQLVEIAYDEPWHRIHLQSLKTAYGKSAFYNEMEDDLMALLSGHYQYLWDLNIALIQYFLHFLPGDLKFMFTTEYVKTYPVSTVDLRSGVGSGKTNLDITLIPAYLQVQRLGKPHTPNLSILDALCHLGPGTSDYLKAYAQKIYHQP